MVAMVAESFLESIIKFKLRVIKEKWSPSMKRVELCCTIKIPSCFFHWFTFAIFGTPCFDLHISTSFEVPRQSRWYLRTPKNDA